MSKPKMAVLAFLLRRPMHGYQIGHEAEKFGLPVWASIKLPSIYKALQDLEASKHIHGEQISEGSAPPRTVYHINEKGKKLLIQLVRQNLANPKTAVNDWWLALSLSWKAVERTVLQQAIQARIDRLKVAESEVRKSQCQEMLKSGELPFVHSHIMRLGSRHHSVELKALKELLEDIEKSGHDDFFLTKGDE